MRAGSFAKRLRALADDIPQQNNELKKMAALEVLTEVVPATPIASGQARSNYITSVGTPDTSTTFPGPGNGDTSLARGRAAIQGAQPGEPIYITNNLPYIGALNRGSSKQAPAGFIEASVNSAFELVKRQRLRWKV